MDPIPHAAFRIRYKAHVSEIKSTVAASKARSIGGTKKDLHQATGIWDTGATATCISEGLAKKINAVAHSSQQITGVTGRESRPVYLIDLFLPNRVIVENLSVVSVQTDGHWDILIGMDVIGQGDFAISNPDSGTDFSFCMPSHEKPLDLLEKSDRVNQRIMKKAKRVKRKR